MKNKLKEKIVKIIKKHNHNRSMSLAEIEALITLKQIKNWQSKWDNILATQILAEFKKEVMDLSTFKTQEEKGVLEEIRKFDSKGDPWKAEKATKSWQDKLKSG